MEDIKIRIARKSDISDLITLLQILFTQEADFQPDSNKQKKGLEMIIDSPDYGRNGHILVATKDDKIIGSLNLLYSVSTVEGAQVVTLEDVVVNPLYRGLGVGKTLVKHAIEFSRSQGFKRITLMTDFDNVNAISLYTKLGFVKSQMIPYRLKL